MATYYAMRASNGYSESAESADADSIAAWIAHHTHGSTDEGFEHGGYMVRAAQQNPEQRLDSDAGACQVSVYWSPFDQPPYWIDAPETLGYHTGDMFRHDDWANI